MRVYPKRFSGWVKFGLPIFAVLLILLLYHAAPLLFSSLIMAWVLYYVLTPAVDLLESHSIRRGLATAFVLMGTLLALYLLGLRLVNASAELRSHLSLEEFQGNLRKRTEQAVLWGERKFPIIKRFIEPFGKSADKVAEELKLLEQKRRVRSNGRPPPLPAPEVAQAQVEHAEQVAATATVSAAVAAAEKQMLAMAPDMALWIAGIIPNLVLIPYFTFFFLKDGRRIKRTVLEWVPNRYFEPALKFFYEVDRRLRSYLQNTLLDCTLVGILVGVGSALVGAPYPVVIGVVAFTFNTIPLLGPLLYGSICLMFIIGAGKSFDVIAGFVGVFALSRLCDDLIFIPTIFGRTHHLHPVVVVSAVLLGHTLAGAWGMLLAIPVVSVMTLSITIVQEISVGEEVRPIPPSASGPFS